MEWNFFTIALSLAYLLALVTIPHLLLLRKRPAATLAWVWALLLFPFFGVLCYWLIGTEYIKRRRLKRRVDYLTHSPLADQTPQEIAALEPLQEWEKDWLRMLCCLQQAPTSSVSSAQLLINATEFYPCLKKRIQEATASIHIQFFIWRDDEVGHEFLELLVEAAKRGVKVRVLVDELGSLGLRRRYFNPLIEAGGEFSWFLTLNPWRHRFFLNLRNHRKLQVIDRKIALVGGMNLGREYAGRDDSLGDWEDLQIEVTGPAVKRLEEQFAEDWYFATERRLQDKEINPVEEGKSCSPCQIIEGGPDSPHERMECALTSFFQFTRQRIWVSTGYFVPSAVLLVAIKMAAWRGVEVRLLIAAKSDHPYLVIAGRSFYQELLAIGVRIYEYSCGINHTKAVLIDEEWLSVGSCNMDNRSMRLNFELNLLLKEKEQAKNLEQLFQRYFSASREITRQTHARRSWLNQLSEAACRPLAPLL